MEDLETVPGRVLRQVGEIQGAARTRSRSPLPPLRGSSASDPPADSSGAAASSDREPGPIENPEEDFEVGFIEGDVYSYVTKAEKGAAAEVDYRSLSAKDKVKFDESDRSEWEGIMASKATEVVSGPEADRIRKEHPERVVTSRMVRRWKKQEGVNSPPKAKSRWCVHGHKDPDTELLQVYSPTPQTESLMTILLMCIGLGMQLAVADLEKAFCQSRPPFTELAARSSWNPAPGFSFPRAA